MKNWQDGLLAVGTGGGSLGVVLSGVESVAATLTIVLTLTVAIWRFSKAVKEWKEERRKKKLND